MGCLGEVHLLLLLVLGMLGLGHALGSLNVLRRVSLRPNSARLAVGSISTSQSSQSTSISFLQELLKPRVIFVLGGPGSGKGTQCLKLSNDFGMKHLSAGELLRAEQASGSANGQLIDSIIKEGRIVPVQITLDLLRHAIEMEQTNRFLIDGFPRNWDNLNGWEGSMLPVCNVESVMFIDCPEEELERRLLSRGLTSGRSDDNLATAKKRFQTFHAATMPIVDHYSKLNKLVRVRGDATIDKVYKDLVTALNPFIMSEVLNLTEALVRAQEEGDATLLAALLDERVSTVSSQVGCSVAAQRNGGGQVAAARLSRASVRVMGKTAVASFSRDGGVSFETMVWNLVYGRWRCVHIHR